MQVTTLKLEDRISHVKDWLLNSGIQSGEGGFYGWEDLESNGYSYLYSEITGYAITALCFLYEITKDDIYITRAKKAAKWIIDRAMHPGGGVLTRDYATAAVEHCSFERGNIYAFDCGTVAFGMLKLYRITKMREFLDAAKRIISFLEINMLKKNGLFYPIYDTKNKRTHQEDTKWSKQSGSFHCKLALCFCELADIEKNNSYANIAENLINASIENFFQNERFITDAADGGSHFHPYCYTIEGMMCYSHRLGSDKFTEMAGKSFDWILEFQKPDGGIPTSVLEKDKGKIPYQRSDIQAQVLRLCLLLGDRSRNKGFDKNKLLARLLQFQNLDHGQKGAFLFGTDEDGSFKKHSNSWCSMFALQTLYLAGDNSRRDLVLDYLV